MAGVEIGSCIVQTWSARPAAIADDPFRRRDGPDNERAASLGLPIRVRRRCCSGSAHETLRGAAARPHHHRINGPAAATAVSRFSTSRLSVNAESIVVAFGRVCTSGDEISGAGAGQPASDNPDSISNRNYSFLLGRSQVCSAIDDHGEDARAPGAGQPRGDVLEAVDQEGGGRGMQVLRSVPRSLPAGDGRPRRPDAHSPRPRTLAAHRPRIERTEAGRKTFQESVRKNVAHVGEVVVTRPAPRSDRRPTPHIFPSAQELWRDGAPAFRCDCGRHHQLPHMSQKCNGVALHFFLIR